MPSIAPSIRLLFFAPFLVIAAYQKSLFISLCYALGCGVVLDLLSDDMRFGVHALSLTVTTFILYEQRRNFFADTLSTLPIMTFFFSVISTLVDLVISYSLLHKQLFSLDWVLCDLLIMPAFDALCALICFVLPGLLFGKKARRGEDYFTST
jgi:rod shape-determining protein MreD